MRCAVFVDRWKLLIDDCLPYENEKVRAAAASALSAFVARHYVDENGEPITELCGPFVEKSCKETMSTVNESTRIGYAIALGIVNYVRHIRLRTVKRHRMIRARRNAAENRREQIFGKYIEKFNGLRNQRRNNGKMGIR